MISSYERTLYKSESGFGIYKFVCLEHLQDNPECRGKYGEDLYLKSFTVKPLKNVVIPETPGLNIKILGHWEIDQKYGEYFACKSVEELPQRNKTGIMKFLTSGSIEGIGPKTAAAIFNKFGDDTLNILDKNPEKLREVPGISSAKAEKMIISYSQYRGLSRLISKLTPLGIRKRDIEKIYQTHFDAAEQLLTENPYPLFYEYKELGFTEADNIAKTACKDFNPCNEERVKSALLEILRRNQNLGNVCLPYPVWLEHARKIINVNCDWNVFTTIADNMAKENLIVFDVDFNSNYFVYLKSTAMAEFETAKMLVEMNKVKIPKKFDIKDEIRLMELEVQIKLAPEQANAVLTSLNSSISVITGGPGTGKTTIINFIRMIFNKNHPNKKILLCAPTGMAARRMMASTGYNAYTIHKALNLLPFEAETFQDEVTPLDADLIIVDEVSMLDINLARTFLSAIKKGAQVVLIGDSNQLPSVGPGAVLSEIINSRKIPVSRLTKVYRQDAESLIALNSLLICKGKTILDYGKDFVFIPAKTEEESLKTILNVYREEVSIYGQDQVTVLSPFRKNTEIGVEKINPHLREIVNPSNKKNKKELVIFPPSKDKPGKFFREGDRVMQVKTLEDVSNGDVGYIREIILDTSGKAVSVIIDFSERQKQYSSEEAAKYLELAYATTVHKSQGSEFKTVIMSLMDFHATMLQRNLVYTGVTRARQKVIIVGQKSALIRAIETEDDNCRRCTLLGQKIQLLSQTEATAV